MAAKYKVMCYSLLLGGGLSLVLIPVFAQTVIPHRIIGGKEGGTPEKQEMHKDMHKKMFQKLDKDGNGKIGKDEFEEAMEEKFKRKDKDGDGFVTQEEWQAAAKEHKKEYKKEHHRGAQEGGGGY
ncbi:Calcium-binding EF-hand-containing protein [Nitrosococcus halophilus Nc 4]|uniref:Calcium-binding EF-hand-containing protein n=1 Tax=Nitrosococcus halophilus (strain Nc4) TaxID=472759 RepID=D5C3Q7_NITHN|nr:EF-hand domain-containing protein [Nitrosococcus halophilus]ADE15029.1 Calcium-binding EF-hand-containing protein [Nitrosococcus halophilus Nc 4]